jgi:hypothetical protein
MRSGIVLVSGIVGLLLVLRGKVPKRRDLLELRRGKVLRGAVWTCDLRHVRGGLIPIHHGRLDVHAEARLERGLRPCRRLRLSPSAAATLRAPRPRTLEVTALLHAFVRDLSPPSEA